MKSFETPQPIGNVPSPENMIDMLPNTIEFDDLGNMKGLESEAPLRRYEYEFVPPEVILEAKNNISKYFSPEDKDRYKKALDEEIKKLMDGLKRPEKTQE